MGWRWTSILSEAGANVVGRRSRVRISVIFAVLAGSGLTIAAAADWATLRSDVAALESQGWTTLIVSVNESGMIDANSCRDTTRLPGVRSAAAVIETTIERFRQLGTRSVPVAVLATTDPVPATEHITSAPVLPGWVGSVLVGDTVGIARLDRRTPGRLPIGIVGVLPTYLDLADFSNSVVVTTPFTTKAQLTRTCVFDVTPSRIDQLQLSIPVALRATTINLTVRRPGSVIVADHPYDDFLDRPQRLVALLVGALGGLIATITARSRNSELGVYRVAGLRRIEVIALQGAEHTIVSGVWLTSATVSTIAASSITGLPLAATLGYQVQGVAVMTVSSLCGVWLMSARNVTQLLKDR